MTHTPAQAARARGGSPWQAAAIAALVVPVVVLALAGPGVLTGAEVLGRGTADSWGHAWGYQFAADAVLSGRFPLADAPLAYPRGTTWWLVDYPVALLLVPVTAVLGATAAYHAALLGHLAVGAAGLAWWLRRHDAPGGVAVGCGLLLALSPFARGAIASGVPETLSFAVIPWLVVALEQGLRGRRGALAAATALCAWLALDGLYGLLPGGLACAAVVVAVGRRDPGRTALRALVPALGAAVPLALSWGVQRALSHPAFASAPGGLGVPARPGQWIVAPLQGADLLNFVAPAFVLPSPDVQDLHRHTVYLGAVVIAVAGAGAVRSREARPLLGLAAVAALLALGPWLTVAGHAWLPLPGVVIAWLGVHHLYRIAGLTVLCLLGAAGLAFVGTGARGRALFAGFLVAALAEAWLAPVLETMPTVPTPASGVERWVRQAPRAGAVVDLPLDRAGRQPVGPWPQRALFLQTVHRRPIASDLYHDPPALDGNETLAALQEFTRRVWKDNHPYRRAWDPRSPPEVGAEAPVVLVLPSRSRQHADAAALSAQGFAWVTLELEAWPRGARSRVVAAVQGWLGDPVHRSPTRWVYALPQPPP